MRASPQAVSERRLAEDPLAFSVSAQESTAVLPRRYRHVDGDQSALVQNYAFFLLCTNDPPLLNAARVCILSAQVSQSKATETTGDLAPKSTQRVPRAVVQNLRHLVFFWKSAVVPEQTPDNRRTFATPDKSGNRRTSFERLEKKKDSGPSGMLGIVQIGGRRLAGFSALRMSCDVHV